MLEPELSRIVADAVRQELRNAMNELLNSTWEIDVVKYSTSPPDSPYTDWEPFAVQGDYTYWRRRT